MSSFSSRMSQTARRLIAQYGQSVIWRQITDGATVDGTKPWNGKAATTVDYPVMIVFLNVGRVGSENQHFTNKSTIPATQRLNINSYNDSGFSEQSAGEVLAYMASQTAFTPTIKDVVIRDGIQHRIINVNGLDPSGPTILWQIELEK